MKAKHTIESMQAAIREFCDLRDWQQFHNPKDLAIGIATEAGELLELFRFKNNEELDTIIDERKTDIAHELIDVLYYILRFADLNGIDLSEAFDTKMQINAKNYPAAIVKGKNKKYTEYL